MHATELCLLVTHACAQDMLGAMQPLDAGPAAPYHVIFWIFLLRGTTDRIFRPRPTTMTDGAVDKLADDVQELHLGTCLLALTQIYRRFLR